MDGVDRPARPDHLGRRSRATLPADDDAADLAVSNLAVAGAADPGAAAGRWRGCSRPAARAVITRRCAGPGPSSSTCSATCCAKAASAIGWPRSIATSPACPTRPAWRAGSNRPGLADVGVEVERWEILFKSSREFLFAPLVELGPLSALEAARRRRRRHAGRLLLHEGGDRSLLQGPPVRAQRGRRRRLGQRRTAATPRPAKRGEAERALSA